MMAKRWMRRDAGTSDACTSFDEAGARESCLHLINFALAVKGGATERLRCARSYERGSPK